MRAIGFRHRDERHGLGARSWLGLCLLLLTGACGAKGHRAPAEAVEAALGRYREAAPVERSVPVVEPVRALLAAGRLEEARERLRTLAPGEASGEAWFLLGYVHQQLQQHALALEPYARALTAGPGFRQDRELFFLYGRCLEETGDLEGARAAYRADAELFPGRGDGPYRLARLDLEAGRLEQSELHAREALERFREPRDVAKVHAHLADLELARGDEQGARAELERCVALFPHYEAFYQLSRVCRALGDEEAAGRYLALHEEWRRRAGR